MILIFVDVRIWNPTIIFYIVTIYIFDREVFKWGFYGEIKLIVAIALWGESKADEMRILAVLFLDFPHIINFSFTFCC